MDPWNEVYGDFMTVKIQVWSVDDLWLEGIGDPHIILSFRFHKSPFLNMSCGRSERMLSQELPLSSENKNVSSDCSVFAE